jgi:hypothetical protein
MLILNATTDTISLITKQACDLDITTHFTDRNKSTGVVGLSDRQLAHPTTATTTTIVAAPGGSDVRRVQSITVRNAHATDSVDIIIQYNANGTLYELYNTRLAFGDVASFREKTGFGLYCLNPKMSATFVAKELFAGDLATVTSTASGVAPVWKFEVPPHTATKKFCWEAYIYVSSATTTTGGQFGIGPVLSVQQSGGIGTAVVGVTTSTLMSACSPASSPTASLASGTSPTTPGLQILTGYFELAANSSPVAVIFSFNSEVAASSVTLLDGSSLCVWEV